MTGSDSTHSPKPSLAEGRWLWRRLYVFGTSALAWLFLDRLIAGMPQDEMPGLAHALMALLGLMLVLYLVAPTAQQLITALSVLGHRLDRERK